MVAGLVPRPVAGGDSNSPNCQNAHEPLAWQKDDEFKHRRNHVSLSRMQGA